MYMKIINIIFLRFTRRYSLIKLPVFKLHLLFLAMFLSGTYMLCNTSLVIAETVETPYGPVEGVDFGKYGDEEFAERSAEEYDGQEAGAGVVTDLVFSLTEENMKKKEVRTTFKQMFEHFCGPCHGEEGNGEGKYFASILEPGPVDLTDADYMSTLSDDHIVRVISGGTASVEKSNLCPPWGKTFSEDRIKGLAAYVNGLSLIPEEKSVEEKTVSDEKVTAVSEGSKGILGSVIIWGILGLICAGIAVGALNEWEIISLKRK
jgi:mono/diheme cytochrome c family protein